MSSGHSERLSGPLSPGILDTSCRQPSSAGTPTTTASALEVPVAEVLGQGAAAARYCQAWAGHVVSRASLLVPGAALADGHLHSWHRVDATAPAGVAAAAPSRPVMSVRARALSLPPAPALVSPLPCAQARATAAVSPRPAARACPWPAGALDSRGGGSAGSLYGSSGSLAPAGSVVLLHATPTVATAVSSGAPSRAAAAAPSSPPPAGGAAAAGASPQARRPGAPMASPLWAGQIVGMAEAGAHAHRPSWAVAGSGCRPERPQPGGSAVSPRGAALSPRGGALAAPAPARAVEARGTLTLAPPRRQVRPVRPGRTRMSAPPAVSGAGAAAAGPPGGARGPGGGDLPAARGAPGTFAICGGSSAPRAEPPRLRTPTEAVGDWASSTIDETAAARICAARTPADLEELRAHLALGGPVGPRPPQLGTWMVWMVHRVALNDPSLVELDLSTYVLPPPEEPRVGPKLASSLGANTHLRTLLLADCGLRGGQQAEALAGSLLQNRALRVLDLSCNLLGPPDLQAIFAALGGNSALEELRCGHQLCPAPGRDALAALCGALKKNFTMRKLGLELADPHYRDTVSRALVRNVDLARRARRAEAPRRRSSAASAGA